MASVEKRFELLKEAYERSDFSRGSLFANSQEDPEGAEAIDELIARGLIEQVGDTPASGSTSFRKNLETERVYEEIANQTDPNNPDKDVLANYLR